MGFFTEIEDEISAYNDKQSSKRCQAYTADLAYAGCGGGVKQSKKTNKTRKKTKNKSAGMKKIIMAKCERCFWVARTEWQNAPCIQCKDNSFFKPIPRKKRKSQQALQREESK